MQRRDETFVAPRGEGGLKAARQRKPGRPLAAGSGTAGQDVTRIVPSMLEWPEPQLGTSQEKKNWPV